MNYSCYDYILEQISNTSIRNFTKKVLKDCPEELEYIPASVSGKYHPPEACKQGGLVYHVQRACWFASLYFRAFNWKADDIRADIILSALLLHDICKRGKYETKFGYVDHAKNAALFLNKYKDELPERTFKAIQKAVLYHMGPFSERSIKKPIEKFTFLELIVYQCDYLSSQKVLDILS